VSRARLLLGRIEEYAIKIRDADRSLAFAAALVKGANALSLADCFVVALAQRLGASIVTGDPEFHQVEQLVAIEWLPRKGTSHSS
jgi:predicted nucleic acid-binding protein